VHEESKKLIYSREGLGYLFGTGGEIPFEDPNVDSLTQI
jgi:hypothetical protein